MNYSTTKQHLNDFFFIFVLYILLLKPAPGIIWGEQSITAFTLLTLLIASVFLIFIILKYYHNPLFYIKTDFKNDKVILFLFLIIFSFLISTVYGLIKVPDKTRPSDFLELYRYAFYFVFYLIARNYRAASISRLVKAAFILIVIIETFGVFQFLNILNINNHIGLLYSMSERHLNMIVHQHRIPSTLLNPNMYGSFLIIVLSILLPIISFTRLKKGLIYLLLVITLVSIILTTSRTAVITAGGIILYWTIFTLMVSKGNIKKSLLNGVSVLSLFMIVTMLLIPRIDYLNYAATQIYKTYTSESKEADNHSDHENYENHNEEQIDEEDTIDTAKKSLESVSSFKNRYDYWEMNYQQFLESPIVGHGPMRSNFVSFADNSYLFILARYGLLGLFIFALGFIFMYWKTFKIARQIHENPFRIVTSTSIHLILVGYLVMGLVSEVWFNLQSMTILFVLLGLLYNEKLTNGEK